MKTYERTTLALIAFCLGTTFLLSCIIALAQLTPLYDDYAQQRARVHERQHRQVVHLEDKIRLVIKRINRTIQMGQRLPLTDFSEDYHLQFSEPIYIFNDSTQQAGIPGVCCGPDNYRQIDPLTE